MHTASAIRLQIEAALAHRIPSALTPAQKIVRPVVPIGVGPVDELLDGGLPEGAITEMVGPECSGRTSLALSLLAGITRAGRVGAWIDVSDTLHPESAAAAGVDLSRLLWVRCGAVPAKTQQPALHSFALPDRYLTPPPVKKGLHGGGFGPHPRTEAKGLPEAVSGLLQRTIGPHDTNRDPDLQPKMRQERRIFAAHLPAPMQKTNLYGRAGKPWSRIEQALRVTDLLLQAGGFSALVLDMGSIAPEYATRVPLATWFRYRAAAERTQATLILLAQHSCAKSSAELLLRLQPSDARNNEATLFTGMEHCLEVARRRFTTTPSNVIPLRKPPQSVNTARWHSQSAWAGPR